MALAAYISQLPTVVIGIPPILLLNNISISPNISTLFGALPSGDIELKGLYNEENSADISFDLGENGCFEGTVEQIPIGKLISKSIEGIFLKGETTGKGQGIDSVIQHVEGVFSK